MAACTPPRPKAQRGKCLRGIFEAWAAAKDEDSAGSAPEAVLQDAGELAIAVGHVSCRGSSGEVFGEGVNHVGEAAEGLVDLGALRQGHAGSARLALPLAAWEACSVCVH